MVVKSEQANKHTHAEDHFVAEGELHHVGIIDLEEEKRM